jgi:signal transduction histidine kinase
MPQSESAPILRAMFERVQHQGHTFGEMELITRDGARLVPIEYSLFRIPSLLKDTLLGLVMRDITANKQSAEDRLRHEQVLRRLISQRTSELAQMNEKMRSELDERKHLEERLVEAQKMEAMGQLSAGIAHEINNPIGYVNVNLEMLSRYLESMEKVLEAYGRLDVTADADIRERLSDIHEMQVKLRFAQIRADIGPMIDDSRTGIARVIDIVRSLRSFSHPEASTLQSVNLVQVMEDSLRVAWNQVKRFELRKEFEDIPEIPGFPIQISQVFVNLLVNAAQSMENSGTITIKIMRKGKHAVVVISDTGKGIPKEHYSRLFDPFFTTKPVGQGTGLGLYISYGIVQKHHGDLVFRSEVDKGTSFQIILPLG